MHCCRCKAENKFFSVLDICGCASQLNSVNMQMVPSIRLFVCIGRGSAEPNCSTIIILMLMMSAEWQHHPCDLIKPNLVQSVLAAAEHLNIIITLLQPLCSPRLFGAWTSLPGRKTDVRHLSCHNLSSLRTWAPTFLSFGSEFHHDPNQK